MNQVLDNQTLSRRFEFKLGPAGPQRLVQVCFRVLADNFFIHFSANPEIDLTGLECLPVELGGHAFLAEDGRLQALRFGVNGLGCRMAPSDSSADTRPDMDLKVTYDSEADAMAVYLVAAADVQSCQSATLEAAEELGSVNFDCDVADRLLLVEILNVSRVLPITVV